MLDRILGIFFLVGLIAAGVMRKWYARRYGQNAVAADRSEALSMWLLMYLWGVAQVMPFFSVFSAWLDFADYDLPTWAGLVGAAIYCAALWLLWRSHVDLGRHFSATLEIRDQHSLVTEGVFRHIRHPMYSAHLLWGIAQALLIQNWIAGLGGLAVFLPLYLLRMRGEEQMMLEEFGDEYRAYMGRTGRVIPRLWR